LLFIAGNLLLLSFLLFIKSKLIELVDKVLCSIDADYFQLLSLVGYDLCLLNTNLFNAEHYRGSLFDTKKASKILLKSVHLNIWCNLLIDPWGDRIEVNPLNLHESQEPLPY
jgi:hypothetical protein